MGSIKFGKCWFFHSTTRLPLADSSVISWFWVAVSPSSKSGVRIKVSWDSGAMVIMIILLAANIRKGDTVFLHSERTKCCETCGIITIAWGMLLKYQLDMAWVRNIIFFCHMLGTTNPGGYCNWLRIVWESVFNICDLKISWNVTLEKKTYFLKSASMPFCLCLISDFLLVFFFFFLFNYYFEHCFFIFLKNWHLSEVTCWNSAV